MLYYNIISAVKMEVLSDRFFLHFLRHSVPHRLEKKGLKWYSYKVKKRRGLWRAGGVRVLFADGAAACGTGMHTQRRYHGKDRL